MFHVSLSLFSMFPLRALCFISSLSRTPQFPLNPTLLYFAYYTQILYSSPAPAHLLLSVTFGSDRIRTYRGKTKRRVRRTAIDCPPQNACRRNEYENRGDRRRPEPSRRIRAFRRTSDRYEGEVSNISSKVCSYQYRRYIY